VSEEAVLTTLNVVKPYGGLGFSSDPAGGAHSSQPDQLVARKLAAPPPLSAFVPRNSVLRASIIDTEAVPLSN